MSFDNNIKSKIRSFMSTLKSIDNRLIFTLFFPILIEQLIITLMGTVHSLMLANVGKEAISAISLVDQLNQFAYAILGSISLGATIIVSQYIGAGKTAEAKSTSEQAVTLGFVVSLLAGAAFLFGADEIFVLFFNKDRIEPRVFDYAMTYMAATAVSFPMISVSTITSGIIRGTGDAKTPMIISIAMGIVNAVVAGICIFALRLEVYGAGVAIFLSRSVGAVIAFTLLLKKRHIRNISSLIKIKVSYILQILRIGIYAGAESMIFQLGRTITQSYFISSGTNHITANGISGNMFNIIAAPGNSMNIVATTLVGRLTGAGEKKRAYDILRNIVLISMALLLAVHLLFMPFAQTLISFYTKDADVTFLVNRVLFLNFIFMPLAWSASFVLVGGMKGAGDARYSTVMSIASMWLIRVLFGYLFGQVMSMGVVGVWLAMFLDWVFRAILAVIRFLSRKWQNQSAI